MNKNHLQVSQLKKGVLKITSINSQRMSNKILFSGIRGIRFYLFIPPEKKHIYIFEEFVKKNFTHEFHTDISKYSTLDSYYEIIIMFDKVISFQNTDELYALIELIVGFNQMLKSIFVSSEYDGYHAHILCKNPEILQDIFLQVNRELGDSFTFENHTFRNV